MISVKGGATENMKHSNKCEWTYKITKQEYGAYLSESFKILSQFVNKYSYEQYSVCYVFDVRNL